MCKDDIQMLLFDLGFEQSDENIEDDYLEFEKDDITVYIDEDNAIAIYYNNDAILKVNDLDYKIIAKIIEGIQFYRI